jgi:hypothetical protein
MCGGMCGVGDRWVRDGAGIRVHKKKGSPVTPLPESFACSSNAQPPTGVSVELAVVVEFWRITPDSSV